MIFANAYQAPGGSNRYPDGMLVKTPYPGIGQEQAPRESWPWMDACIEMQVGHDEWLVIVSDPAADEVGPDGEIESSWCYRGSDEITGRWW